MNAKRDCVECDQDCTKGDLFNGDVREFLTLEDLNFEDLKLEDYTSFFPGTSPSTSPLPLPPSSQTISARQLRDEVLYTLQNCPTLDEPNRQSLRWTSKRSTATEPAYESPSLFVIPSSVGIFQLRPAWQTETDFRGAARSGYGTRYQIIAPKQWPVTNSSLASRPLDTLPLIRYGETWGNVDTADIPLDVSVVWVDQGGLPYGLTVLEDTKLGLSRGDQYHLHPVDWAAYEVLGAPPDLGEGIGELVGQIFLDRSNESAVTVAESGGETIQGEGKLLLHTHARPPAPFFSVSSAASSLGDVYMFDL